jgi:hypothetical protein
MMRQRCFCLIVSAVALVVGLASVAQAYPIYSRFYRLTYHDQGGCNICHHEGGGTKRNGYGDDWQGAGEGMEAFTRIEGRDSDRDGASNLAEIKAGSNPGDATSTPARPGIKWRLRHGVPIPTDQIGFALGNAPDFGYREADLSKPQVKRLEAIAGRPLRAEERYPTLYFALNKTRRTGAIAMFVYPDLPAGRGALLMGLQPDGKIRRLFLLRAGDDDLKTYNTFIECLERAPPTASPDQPSCPPTRGREASARAISQAVDLARATLAEIAASD